MTATADLPVMFDVDAWVDYFAVHGDPDREALGIALARIGRNDAPYLLLDLHAEKLLTTDAAAFGVSDAWCMAEFPLDVLTPESWRDLFALAGYTVDGVPATRPREPLTLFRGACSACQSGWSWTDNLDVATAYAEGRYRRPAGRVWTAVVPPAALLARITDRNEHEYVVDTTGLTITAR